MNFAEVRFWELLLLGLILIGLTRAILQALKPKALPTFERVALALLGLSLLMAVGLLTFLVFLGVALGTYVAVNALMPLKPDVRRRFLLLLVPLQLTPILYYKYSDFICNRVLQLDYPGLHHLLIPVGISFYTFQKIAFLVDTLVWERPIPAFLDYMNFVSFFPQIVAGPIERRDNLLPQMQRFCFRYEAAAINSGLRWIVLGLFLKCCLADNLALYFSGESATNAYLIWLDNFLFGLRIYFDFAGYSLVALGLAECLGIRLTLNFASPYVSTSVIEFWRRWHISLSQWFRDYIYVPLGGGRTAFWAVNVLVVFVVSGLWHGAGWNFLLWGALHGLYLITNRLWGKQLRLPPPVAWFLTMIVTFLAWLCFYESRTDVLFRKLASLSHPGAYGRHAVREAIHQSLGPEGFVMVCFLAVAATVLVLEWLSVRWRNEPYYYLRHPVVCGVLIFLALLLAPGTNNSFIYFAF
jgi:D-alanyl-lipoteichoic acid acyltransferase DltB (MBOAT superfamily)